MNDGHSCFFYTRPKSSVIIFYHSWHYGSGYKGPPFAIYGKLPDLTSVMTQTSFCFTLLLALVFALSRGLLYMLHVPDTLDKIVACHTKSYYTTHTTIIITTFVL